MHRNPRRVLLGAILSCGVLCAPSVWGADLGNPKEFVKAMNVQGSMDKLGRGASNTLTGWMEIPYRIDDEWKFSGTGFIAAATVGVAKGLVLGMTRTAVGLFEVVTFWAPVPENYGPIIPDAQYFAEPK